LRRVETVLGAANLDLARAACAKQRVGVSAGKDFHDRRGASATAFPEIQLFRGREAGGECGDSLLREPAMVSFKVCEDAKLRGVALESARRGEEAGRGVDETGQDHLSGRIEDARGASRHQVFEPAGGTYLEHQSVFNENCSVFHDSQILKFFPPAGRGRSAQRQHLPGAADQEAAHETWEII
jgi:hypothetical protein